MHEFEEESVCEEEEGVCVHLRGRVLSMCMICLPLRCITEPLPYGGREGVAKLVQH